MPRSPDPSQLVSPARVHWLDQPIGAAFGFGRTPREMILVGGGLMICGYELSEPALVDWGNLAVYVLFTVAFATRFFAARALTVAIAIAAIAQRWAVARWGWAGLEMPWDAYLPFVGLPLLASQDLVERFDRAPSWIRWWPNYWAELPARHARRLRWCGYGAAGVIAVLHQAWEDAGGFELLTKTDLSVWEAGWPLLATALLGLCLLLLVRGWAPVLLVMLGVCVGIIVGVAPDIAAAEAMLAGERLCSVQISELFSVSPEYVFLTLLFTAGTVVLAAPYGLRLVWRTLLRPRH